MTDLTSAITRPFSGSYVLHERAAEVLPGGVSTAFRAAERPVPLFIREAQGAHLVDVDGREYVDFVCGFGPVILGHSHPEVTDAVTRAAAQLQQVGGQHLAEIELAERLVEHVPAFEMIRPAGSGSEAVHAALRLARAATGRAVVVKFAGQYHGWLDNVYANTTHLPPLHPESRGLTSVNVANLIVLEWNDRRGLEQTFAAVGHKIAALIMEPYPCNGGVIPPEPGFLEAARALTTRHGSALIFDEVITGFRVGLAGAHGLAGVIPDLAVVAKALGNGVPIAAFGGRRELMELLSRNEVVHAGTYNAGGLSVAAALATLDVLEREPIHERLRALGTRLRDGLAAAAARHGQRLVAAGPGPVFFTWLLDDGEVRTYSDHLRADFASYGRFAELLLHRGVRVIPGGRWYLNAAHTDDDIDRALAAADEAFGELAS